MHHHPTTAFVSNCIVEMVRYFLVKVTNKKIFLFCFLFEKLFEFKITNKTGLQPVSRPVGQILGFYPKGFSAKRCLKFFFKPTGAKSLKGAGPSAPPNLFPNGEVFGRFVGKTSLTKNVEMISGVGGRGGGTKIL